MLTQLFRLNGAFILSRSGSDDSVPPATLARFEAAVREHGYNTKDFCIWDYSQCTNGWNGGASGMIIICALVMIFC